MQSPDVLTKVCSSISRRSFLSAATAATVVLPRVAWPATVVSSRRLSTADVNGAASQSNANIQRRFDLFKQAGIGLIRMSVAWWDVETADGKWRDSPSLRYIDLARKNGFTLKLEIATWGAVPDWFMSAHPDAALVNEAGLSARGYISPWYPGLATLLAEKSDRIAASLSKAGVFSAVDSLVVDLGPAGEPVYPANWILKTKSDSAMSFWWFGAHADESFRAHLKQKYGSVDALNHVYRVQQSTFDNVKLPKSHTLSGAQWSDVLVWYRDAKRSIITAQIAEAQSLLSRYAASPRPSIIVLVPGGHISQNDWGDSLRTGDGRVNIKIMTDTDFLVTEAAAHKCNLQYTAAESESEIQYLLQDEAAIHQQIPTWAENAGPKSAIHPELLVDIVLRNHLYGFEYINAAAFLEADMVTPNEIFPQFVAACRRAQRYFAS